MALALQLWQVVVKRRGGFGWTFNFAHPVSWVFVLIVLLLPFLPWLLGKL